MSRDASIELPFPDATHVYRLRIGELRQLQEKCDKGPMQILTDLLAGRWRVDDVIQPLRLGLIGGGMKMADANKLIEQTITPGPSFQEAVVFAAMVVKAAVVGPADEELEISGGKDETPTTGSASASSTDKEPSSDGQPERSIN